VTVAVASSDGLMVGLPKLREPVALAVISSDGDGVAVEIVHVRAGGAGVCCASATWRRFMRTSTATTTSTRRGVARDSAWR
jgi:hypothetical protein